MITAITCTRGRHSTLERCLELMLMQDYEGKLTHLIFNNSHTEQKLADNLDTENRKIVLINQSICSTTREPYKNLKEIFSDAMMHVPSETTVVTFFDDDDVFLSNHISEGAKGWVEGNKNGMEAYKPYYSFLQSREGIEKTHNVCEPSWFISKKWVEEHGFIEHSAAYHDGWLKPLIANNLLYEPENGIPTLVYQWVGGVHHLSGDGENPNNLRNHHRLDIDEGDGIITPRLAHIA